MSNIALNFFAFIFTYWVSLPKPEIPNIELWKSFIQSGILASLVVFSISISLAKLYSKMNKYEIDSTQVIVAIYFMTLHEILFYF